MRSKKKRNFALLELIKKPYKTFKPLTGFTLQEILVVIIIIAILVALALPQFGVTRERALTKEAMANLKLIAAAEKIYRLEFSGYYPLDGIDKSNVDHINTDLKLSLSETNWDYSVTGGVGSFVSNATRQSGPYSSCNYSINEGQFEPGMSSGTCP